MWRKLVPIIFLAPLLLTLWANAYFRQSLVSNSNCREVHLKEVRSEMVAGAGHFDYAFQLNSGEYLIAGNLVNRHEVLDPSGSPLTPLTSSVSRVADTWPRYFAYEVKESGEYRLNITRDSRFTHEPFSGLMPRACQGYESSVATTIIPTATSYSNTLGLTVSAFLIFVVFLTRSRRRNSSYYIFNSLFFAMMVIASLKANHNYDGVIFKSKEAQYFLRLIVTGLVAYPLYVCLEGTKISRFLRTAIIFTFIAVFGWLAPFLEIKVAGMALYSIGVTALPVLLSVYFLSKRKFAEAVSLLLFPLDALPALHMQPTDFPMVSSWFPAIVGFYGCTLWAEAAASAFSLLARQVLRIGQHDLHKDIEVFLGNNAEKIASGEEEPIRALLPMIANAFAANSVSLTINGGEHASTYSFDRAENKLRVRPKEAALGLILNRVLLFGDNFYLENVASSTIAKDRKFREKGEYKQSRYFTCFSLSRGSSLVGAISITEYRDEDLFDQGFFCAEVSGEVRSLQLAFLNNLNSLDLKSSETRDAVLAVLKNHLFRSVHEKQSSTELIQNYANKLLDDFGVAALVYRAAQDRGSAPVVAAAGRGKILESEILSRPLRLGASGENQSGPAVVAILEGKSSLISNQKEFSSVLHPETVRMLNASSVLGLGSYAIRTNTAAMALVIFYDESGDPSLMDILHEVQLGLIPQLESLIELADSKREINAFNVITDRLVSDPALKSKIFNNSIDGQLPATIGHEESGLLVNLDLIESKLIRHDSESRANFLGKFFDLSLRAFRSKFSSANVCKSTGDGLIIRIPIGSGSNPKFDELICVLSEIGEFTRCNGMKFRTSVSYGKYFVGIVGTNSFGQLDAIGHDVDRVFRIEQHVKEFADLEKRQLLAMCIASMGVLSGTAESPDIHFWSKKTGSVFVFSDFFSLVREVKKVA